MKRIVWLIPLFFAVPVIIGLLDFYVMFITGKGFINNCGIEAVAFRLLLLIFSGFLAIISGAFAITGGEGPK